MSSTATNTASSTATTTPETSTVTSTVTSTTLVTTTASTACEPSPSSPAGAIAGAAVGCLVAGLLLGVLAAFFLHRRRGKKGKRYRQRGPVTTKELDLSSPDHHSPSNDIQLDCFLLDATPNRELVSELRALGDLVHMHVENNYQFQAVQANSSAITQSILNLGFPQASADAVATLCLDPRTRAVGLRHVISRIAFASIDFNARSSLSMLPAPIAAFLQSMPPVEPHSGNPLATSLALSKWRVLSAFLLHPARSERTPLALSEATAIPQSNGLASALNTVLHHFVPSEPGQCEAQTEHLKDVILEFAKFGYVLLSQGSDWRFTYETSTAGESQRAVVVCAGLEKLSHRDGRRYGSPQLVEAPRVVLVS
ncbi:hypothetical protein ACJZ2D_005476 [Fusarium nematophilum]